MASNVGAIDLMNAAVALEMTAQEARLGTAQFDEFRARLDAMLRSVRNALVGEVETGGSG
jgi:hypothetical protein